MNHGESSAPVPAVAPEPVEAAAAVPAEESVFRVADAERLELSSGTEHKHLLQRWKGRIDPPVTTWADLGALEAEGATLPFALPDGTTAPVVFKRLERFAPNKGVFVATLEGHPFAEAYFSYVNQAVSGVIRYPDLGVSWEIRNAGDGAQYFEQVDLDELGECGVCKAEEK